MSTNEFEKIMKITKIALLWSGIKTSYTSGNRIMEYFINNCLFYCNFTVLYTVIFGEILWVIDGIQTSRPFVELSLTSPCITISMLGTIKSLFLYLNKATVLRVVNELKEMHATLEDNDNHGEMAESERIIVKESKKLFTSVKVLQLVISVVVLTTFCLIPGLLMWYKYNKTGELVVKYPFLVKYFFDVYKSSWWQLLYFHQVWATAIVTLNIFGCDTLLFALCVFIQMHFRLLGLEFENNVSNSKSETKINLVKSVMKHQVLIDLVNQTEILYSKSTLFNIVTSSILICLSAFNISGVSDSPPQVDGVIKNIETKLAFISFLWLSLSQISLMCYFADMLMRSSTEISGSVFKCPWYETDEDCKKIILLVIMRSQKACRLTAWNFADLNLRAFTTILSRSWSYFALLKTVYK